MDAPKVLILEPDDQIRLLLTNLLRRGGYDVTPTTGGDRAVLAFAMHEFDVFIIDVSLRASMLEQGTRRGLGFLHFLERKRPDVLPRVIVTTAMSMPQVEQGLPAACKVLQKPFDIEELMNAVSSCGARSAQRSAAAGAALLSH